MNREEILACWMQRHGSLDRAVQTRFIAQPEVELLTGYPDDLVMRVINKQKGLDTILKKVQQRSAHQAESRPPSESRNPKAAKPPRYPAAGTKSAKITDTDLHKSIGPVQDYDDTL